jgi:hypothetical protein
MMLRAAGEFSRRLLSLNWSIEFDHRREFIISDSPVVVWRKPTARDDVEGFGIENGDEIRFPLDPGTQFVLSRDAGRHRSTWPYTASGGRTPTWREVATG